MISPWNEFVNKFQKLVEEDDEINVIYKENDREMRVYVNSIDKYKAFSNLLPEEKTFGNVKLKINVIPPNDDEKMDNFELLKKAFKGNPVFVGPMSVPGTGPAPALNFLIFEREVVDYYNDDIGTPTGHRSTIYQELAKEVFDNIEDVKFATLPE